MDTKHIIHTLDVVLGRLSSVEEKLRELKKKAESEEPKPPKPSIGELDQFEGEGVDLSSLNYYGINRTPSSVKPERREMMERSLRFMFTRGFKMNAFEEACWKEWDTGKGMFDSFGSSFGLAKHEHTKPEPLPKRPSEWGGGLIEFGDFTTKTTRTPSSFNPKDRKKMESRLIQMLLSRAEMNDFEKQCVEEWKLDGVAEQQKHEKIWRAIYFKDDKPKMSHGLEPTEIGRDIKEGLQGSEEWKEMMNRELKEKI